jgi:hypothetical protein
MESFDKDQSEKRDWQTSFSVPETIKTSKKLYEDSEGQLRTYVRGPGADLSTADLNGDGFINQHEVKTAAAYAEMNGSRKTKSPSSLQLDLEHGSLSMIAFSERARSRRLDKLSSEQQNFIGGLYDDGANNAKGMSNEDFIRASQLIHTKTGLDFIFDHWKRMDGDADGKISPAEFKALIDDNSLRPYTRTLLVAALNYVTDGMFPGNKANEVHTEDRLKKLEGTSAEDFSKLLRRGHEEILKTMKLMGQDVN